MQILDMVLPEFDHETAVTRLLIERAPESRLSWAPHPRSWTLGELCLHLAELPLWGVTVMQQTAYDLSPRTASRLVRNRGPSRKRRRSTASTNTSARPAPQLQEQPMPSSWPGGPCSMPGARSSRCPGSPFSGRSSWAT